MSTSAPYQLKSLFGTLTNPGDTVVIPPPGPGKRLVIVYLRFARATSIDVTLTYLDGATAVDSIALTVEIPTFLETLTDELAFRLSEGASFGIHMSNAGSVKWRIRYRIEDI